MRPLPNLRAGMAPRGVGSPTSASIRQPAQTLSSRPLSFSSALRHSRSAPAARSPSPHARPAPLRPSHPATSPRSPTPTQVRSYGSEAQKEGNGLIGATRALATTDWLERNLGLVVPVDGSFHLPTTKRNAFDEYKRCHIKNARFFDIETVKDPESPYPHMLPSADDFAKHMGALGISDEDHVVIYDSVGVFSSPRIWWMFKVFGHDKVSVLDGGLPKWVKEGRSVMDQEPKITPKFYKAKKPQQSLVVPYSALLSHLTSPSPPQIIDARASARFTGAAPEPRAGIPSGHMPGAINVPFSEIVDPETGVLLSKERLTELFKAKGVDLDQPIITTCGSGVSACSLLFALDRIGAKSVALYDGSWSEYAERAEVDGLKIESRGKAV